MATESEIESTQKLLTDLGDRLHYEVTFAKQFEKESSRPDIEKEWMLNVYGSCNYSLILVKSFLNSINDYKHLPSNQFNLYVGKIAIQHLLELINVFELTLNKFILENESVRTIIEERIEQKTAIINTNWNAECTGKDKKLKKSIINQYKTKIHEMSFIRDTLYSSKIIDQHDYDIWSFAWNIRNSMHRNFTSVKDVDFKHPDIKTGVVYHFKYAKGQDLFHPGDFIAFYTITAQLIFILLKILQIFGEKGDKA